MLEGFIPSVKRLILLILVGCAFFVGTQAVFAQAFPPGSPPDPFTPPTGPGGAEGFEDRFGGGTPSSGNGNTVSNPPGGVDAIGENIGFDTSVQAPPPNQPPVIVTDSPSCWSSGQQFLNCILVSFFGSIVAVAGYTFDASISLFIVGFGDLYLNAGIGATVEQVWTTVRDVFNLTFIFGLVYIGFQIILGTNESSAKRTLPLLILAALLVNFSLFVVKFIVDFANLAAIQIYNLFTVGDQATPSTNSPVDILTLGDVPSISLAFINTIGVTGLLGHTANTAEGVPIFYTFGMIIIFLVLTYVFFAGAILIAIRFAVLIFYMIFSPVMFLGWVFPGFKSYTDKFWRGLIGQAFFAPALLFMLYVSYQLARGFDDGNRVGGEGVYANPNSIQDFAAFMPYLVVIVIFIVASLIVARKMADTGGSMVMKANDWALGKAKVLTGAATAGVAGRVGRNTLGAGAYALQNNNTFKDIAARNGRLGKMMYSGVGKVADSSYDARKIAGMGKKLGVGEGRKGGFATILKEEKEADEKFLKSMGERSFDDYDPRGKELKKKMGDAENVVLGIKAQIAEAYRTGRDNDVPFLQSRLAPALASFEAVKSEYDALKKTWSTSEEYGRQLSYIKSIENWQKTQRGGVVGILAGSALLTSGGSLAAAGALAGASSAGYWYNTKKSASSLRKDYGKDGSAKKKSDSEKKAREKALAALGLEEKKDDHGKKNDEGSSKGGGHAPAPAAAKSSPAPKAAPAGGGDHH